ncbi:2-dehydropantoate 2-reductase [Peribacillus huizhouensis]|uniref:2-dehydropantoate 2-reductase n=1 Tax=Peribacillus huizhouensis TaxID=1501239 RepID=A0ABR6CKB5_9BACI|nr:2-dehydropantoate 2-reductase [Peribacillus huizhouensis]MBA9024975.1 2-dehydropantoate 2-reductase [Peribacillus huizhouensis]
MDIGIIGGGSIGLLFAAYLQGVYEITLYTRTKKQADELMQLGLTLKSDGLSKIKKVKVVPIFEGIAKHDLLFIAVKQYHLHEVIPLIQDPEIPLVFLQNGYSHIKMIKQSALQEIYIGVVEHGALKHDNTTVEHTGLGVTRIAAYSGKLKDFPLFQREISMFPFKAEKDFQEMLLNKLLVNAMINPLTAILKVENGELINNPHFYLLFKKYFEEISNIFEIENREQVIDHIEQICLATSKNRSSMLKDIELGRKTEIDAITGYIMESAIERKKPYEMTAIIYSLVKGMES